MSKKIVLTGDRSTGPLHLGHFAGSLANRLVLQENCTQYVMVADMQALSDNAEKIAEIENNIFTIVLDYLSVGIDPKKTTIFVQSQVTELCELTMYFLNLVTWNRLKHNPTVKAEIRQKGFGENVPAGFMIYPISQAADITAFKTNIVPVGEDQLPMIEQTIELVRKFNRTYRTDVLVEPEALVSSCPRLPGIDGKAKMSKSLGNAIYLSDSLDVVASKIKGMYTDPSHLHVEDPGKVEGNPVFAYLDVFDSDKEKLNLMKEHYQRGGLGDSTVKKHLLEVLVNFLEPIHKRRKEYSKEDILEILKKGSITAKSAASKTLGEVRKAMGIYLSV